jgi:serine/threonine protein phosphatase PrpC
MEETLEDAAKEFFRKFKHTHSPDNYYLALVKFAEWQAERMYSEEDLRETFKQSRQ